MANHLKSLNEIDLEELESFASLHFSIRELATMFHVDKDELEIAADNEESAIHYAIHRGRLKSEAEVRNAAFTLARNGSTQGIKESMEFIRKNKLSDG
jgi:hypothetical protein